MNDLALYTAGSFVFGAICSGIAGYMGMYISIRTNIRTASAARTSLNRGLQIALRGGAVSGLFVVAMSLLGVGGLYLLLSKIGVTDHEIPLLIVGYGFGASFVALFAQLGGGIYTKAADVGADLVGKVEAGIPEDDPRNPAVIADLVGDNVGDCAGRGADLFESTAAENIGAMILGATLAAHAESDMGITFAGGIVGVMLFPLVARAFGLLASIVGVMVVKTKEEGDPMAALNKGYYVTTFLAAIGFGVGCYWLLDAPQAPDAWWHFWLCGLVGLATAMASVYITQYYTEYKYRPVREIATASQTGAATNIITGFAVALECTALPVITISIAIIGSYYLGLSSGLPNAGLFGTAVATMGMLGTAAYILAMDTFGPIADNAGGIIEMSQQPEEIRKKTDRLDAVGNTTKALTKGYAIGSAALAAFLLFSAYLDEVEHYKSELREGDRHRQARGLRGRAARGDADLPLRGARHPGGRQGRLLRHQRGATAVQGEPRDPAGHRQNRITGSASTSSPLARSRKWCLPGVLVIAMPIAVGIIFKMFGLGAQAVAAMLMVGTMAGILVATMLNNGGGAWDNAKKFVETGMYGGKGSDTHKAAVVGDTVGDPFKDTAGPSLHVVIKLLSTITLVLAPFFI